VGLDLRLRTLRRCSSRCVETGHKSSCSPTTSKTVIVVKVPARMSISTKNVPSKTLRVFGWALVLNLVWEMAQMSAYVSRAEQSHAASIRICVLASIADAAVITLVFAVLNHYTRLRSSTCADSGHRKAPESRAARRLLTEPWQSRPGPGCRCARAW
jgi:hypothetical protein